MNRYSGTVGTSLSAKEKRSLSDSVPFTVRDLSIDVRGLPEDLLHPGQALRIQGQWNGLIFEVTEACAVHHKTVMDDWHKEDQAVASCLALAERGKVNDSATAKDSRVRREKTRNGQGNTESLSWLISRIQTLQEAVHLLLVKEPSQDEYRRVRSLVRED